MLYHERHGQGTLLVCLHGWGMDSTLERADFEPLFEERSGWERLYLDLPGMGQSPADPRLTNLDELLGALLESLDVLTAGRPFALSGTSAGGYLARGVVAARREQVLGLMLRVPMVQPGWIARELPTAEPLIQTPAYREALGHKQRILIGPAEERQNVDFLARLRQPKHYGFRAVPEQQGPPFAGPTLIVTGRQDTVTGYRDAWSLLEHYPRATYAVLDGAAHEWPLPAEQHRLFAALVGDWLDRTQQTSANIHL